MQDNTTHGFSVWSTTILDGHVLEPTTFHTQISYNLYRHVAKILLQSYLEQPSPPTVSCVYNFYNKSEVLKMSLGIWDSIKFNP
jgi:hypothetical protein